jgi:hypothetical protein
MRTSKKMLAQLDFLEPAMRKLCEESSERLRFPDAKAVFDHFRALNTSGNLERSLSSEITSRLTSSTPNPPEGLEREGFLIQNAHLRHIARTFYFERVLLNASHSLDEVMDALTARLQNGIGLPPIDDPSWPAAIDMARGIVVAGFALPKAFPDVAIGKELRKLVDAGFPIQVSQGNVWMTTQEQERVASSILEAFRGVGLVASLDALLTLMKGSSVFRDGQYLFPRTYGLTERPPSVPFNLLLNIAVKSAPLGYKPSERDFKKRITEAITLGQQLAAVADVEPYSQWSGVFIGAEDVEIFLRDTAIYDHLFTLRQWPPDFACFLLETFFGTTFDSSLLTSFGWVVDDAVRLVRRMVDLLSTDPGILTPGKLAGNGLTIEKIMAMLPHFAHPIGEVNSNYSSGVDAPQGDLFFRPLIHVHLDTYVVPALSMGVYAAFEATLAAVRKVVSASAMSDLAGDGTERIVLSAFSRAHLHPTVNGKTYQASGEVGECDLVFEDSDHILFIECKAKPLTRAAMAGTSGEALFDFTGGILHSQGQALRHERILRNNGFIDFENGYRLQFADRKILRLSVTLMDLGALQDRSTFINLFEQLARIEVSGEPGYSKAKELKKVNEKLHDFRKEVIELDQLGQNARAQALRTICLSVGQLVILLNGASDLSTFIKRMPLHVMTGSGNALADYYRFRDIGMFKDEVITTSSVPSAQDA